MSEKPDVFVIGGGPAGLAAAIAARQAGMSVMLADGGEPPIDKPCGEGLLPETLAALAELKVQVPKESGFPFRGIRFFDGEMEVGAELPRGRAIGVRRTVLHDLLIARAKECGVELLWKRPVRGIEQGSVDLGNRRVACRWIVGADGIGSRVRRWSGLVGATKGVMRFASRRHYRIKPWAEHLEIHWGPGAQAYVTPIANEEVCVVVLADAPEEVKLAESWTWWPQLGQRIANAEVISRERGAVSLIQSLQDVYRGSVALVGDASGSVDAITGDGLRLAFRQSLGLAAAMKSGDLQPYQAMHRRLMRRPTWMGHMLLWLGRNESTRRRAFRVLAGSPELFGQFVAMHVEEYPASRLVGFGAQLGWVLLAA